MCVFFDALSNISLARGIRGIIFFLYRNAAVWGFFFISKDFISMKIEKEMHFLYKMIFYKLELALRRKQIITIVK